MAPEVLMQSYGPEADIWSAGKPSVALMTALQNVQNMLSMGTVRSVMYVTYCIVSFFSLVQYCMLPQCFSELPVCS